MKQKILFILVSDEYVRNFFQTGIVNRLKKKFDLKYYFDGK